MYIQYSRTERKQSQNMIDYSKKTLPNIRVKLGINMEFPEGGRNIFQLLGEEKHVAEDQIQFPSRLCRKN
jgi:hypothetical protein